MGALEWNVREMEAEEKVVEIEAHKSLASTTPGFEYIYYIVYYHILNINVYSFTDKCT